MFLRPSLDSLDGARARAPLQVLERSMAVDFYTAYYSISMLHIAPMAISTILTSCNYSDNFYTIFGHLRRKEMPDEPFAAAEWLLPKLLTDLSLSKTIPLKLSHMQHQQALCG
jgi:hypothetical protein